MTEAAIYETILGPYTLEQVQQCLHDTRNETPHFISVLVAGVTHWVAA